ncbi:protein translocase subunit SecD [Vitreoscilla massiliensis]|uniref:Protein translocase subunit SecD n=1 Tax=Vitreoscilla massiliensis TaxID=1689272 RepID=A0ABY4E561_9NEIS|nr:protein translocase subunit SecD [Vitreoscilla massiliensis]UOO88572.1 protein translocase subunit SecD [Vitreoscilla massiliensis]
MNRYPLWKYLLIAVLVVLSCLYTIPNFYGETPAVQISTNRQAIQINDALAQKVSTALTQAKISTDGQFFDGGSLKVRFNSEEDQIKARDVIDKTLGEGYIIALNLIPNTPVWMSQIGARPMFLGLDLRGGVHFTMQVDMAAAKQKTLERIAGDIRREAKKQKFTISDAKIGADKVTIPFQNAADAQAIVRSMSRQLGTEANINLVGDSTVEASLSEAQLLSISSSAVAQNMNTLHNRVNELGVAEPVIQQAGADRIVVQLPGVQDTAKAKDILGRTATLEVRMVSDDPALMQQAMLGTVPEGYELLPNSGGQGSTLVSKQVELTGDNINDAQPGFTENNQPSVNLVLDSSGSDIFADLTRANKGKRMAMVLKDQGTSEVVTAPNINEPITGGRVQISGSMTSAEANDTALLLRAGSLAAPMKIIEERTIGPSLGAENIKKGFHSTLWGFVAVACFMILYYRVFGVFSAISLTFNLLFLIAILSILQATLTLPGIAAIALTLGMAIDSNVLINERIREELRAGHSPQVSINKGYEHAWDTIVDSNITSLIAGLALLVFGSGPVRGFAVVHCIGILTSMFSSVVCSRALVNLWYGRRSRLKSVSIGHVWRPDAAPKAAAAEKE